MANENEITETVVEQAVEQQASVPSELDALMQMSLSDGMPKEVVTEINEEAVVNVTEAQPPVFEFKTFTDKYGWQNPEDAETEIQELRKLKDVKPEFKFENDKSKVLFEAIQSGKTDEVFKVLEEQRKLDNLTASDVTKDNAGDIIKLSMQLKYKDLTDAEINYKFNKQYGVPKEPVQTDMETDDEFEERKSDWNEKVAEAEMNKIIEAKLAKPDLESAKSKLVLPSIDSEQDEDYLQYKQSLENEAQIDAERNEAYRSFKAQDLGIKMNFNDEANKIQFDFQFEPDQEGFAKAVEFVTEPEKYFSDYKNSDGTPNRKKFLEDMYFTKNKERVIMEAMKQAKNATIKSMLPDNSSGGLNRQIPQGQEMSELDAMMQASLQGYPNNR